jgi:hypothetical protein
VEYAEKTPASDLYNGGQMVCFESYEGVDIVEIMVDQWF